MRIIISKTGVPIRFPEERWFHITEEHSEMAGYYFDVLETVEEPGSLTFVLVYKNKLPFKAHIRQNRTYPEFHYILPDELVLDRQTSIVF